MLQHPLMNHPADWMLRVEKKSTEIALQITEYNNTTTL